MGIILNPLKRGAIKDDIRLLCGRFNTMRRISIFLIVFFSLMSQHVAGQKALADSVQRVLEDELPDSTRVLAMLKLGLYTEAFDNAKAIEIYDETITFCIERKMDYYAGLAHWNQAYAYQSERKSDLQHQALARAIGFFMKSDHPKAKDGLASAYGDMAIYFQYQESFDTSARYYLKQISVLEKLENTSKLVTSYVNLSMLYQQLKVLDKLKHYLDKALSTAKKSGVKKDLFSAYVMQPHYYTEIGDFRAARSYLDTARLYIYPGIDKTRLQIFYLFSASTWQNLMHYDSAIYYYQKVYHDAQESKNSWSMVEPLLQIGYVHLQQKNYKEAEKYIKEGIALAEKDSIKTFMKEGYGTLSDVYVATGNWEGAYKFYKKYTELKDTLQSQEQESFILELEKKYETEKKDDQITIQKEQLKNRATLNYILMGSAVFILIVSILSYLTYRQRQNLQQQRIAELEKEKQLLASEAVIKGQDEERGRLAKDLHDGLGGLLSGIKFSLTNMKSNVILDSDSALVFERSLDMLDHSIAELRRVAHNMMPEVLVKFGLAEALKSYCAGLTESQLFKIDFQSIGMESRLASNTEIFIYRIVQELLSNTAKHAKATQVLVQLARQNGEVSITVEDDGVGFDTSLIQNTTGAGWANIQSRVEYLKGKLDVQSAFGQGTSVHITIPAS